MDKIEDINWWNKLAAALSFKAKERKWSPEEIIEVEVDGKRFSIGPFENSYHQIGLDLLWKNSNEEEITENRIQPWDDVYYFTLPNSKYAVGMIQENWDSWGRMYDDFGGNHFEVYIIKSLPIHLIFYPTTKEYDEMETIEFPSQGPRW